MFIFQFLNDKIHNYVLFDIIVNFTHFPQKIYKLSKTNIFFSCFERTRGEEKNISHLSQDAADLNSQESKDEKSKSEKSKSEKSEKLVKKEPAPVDAFVHVIGHPDEQNSPKSASLKKDNLVIVDKPLEQSHSEVGIS